MASPAHALALHLSGLGGIGAFGGSAKWAISVGKEPATPDGVITLYDTGGDSPMNTVDDCELIGLPTVQVRIREFSYPDAYAKQVQIRSAFKAIRKSTISGQVTYNVIPVGDIFSLGQDSNNRFLLTANYRLMRV